MNTDYLATRAMSVLVYHFFTQDYKKMNYEELNSILKVIESFWERSKESDSDYSPEVKNLIAMGR